MKNLSIVMLIFFSLNSFGGGRHIYCEGKVLRFDVPAKGTRPTKNNFVVLGLKESLRVREIITIDDDDSYDFSIVYQAINSPGNIVVVLSFIDDLFDFSVFKDGQSIEENSPCRLEFFESLSIDSQKHLE